MPHFHHHHHQRSDVPRQSAPSLPPPTRPSTEYILLEPAALELRREGERLQIRQGGEREWREVTLVRLFPLTEPDRWLAVLDAEGNEVGILRDLAKLSKDDRGAARDELDRRYLVPRIQRILACRARFDLLEWTVETDRGETKFLTRHLREQVKEVAPERLSLIDVEGNRYDVPSLDALDPESRRLLEQRV